ncbi:MAG: PQQ-binding-like beta-propeller repeat protein [Candidatus Bathyarchaeota archaeon]|nr:PQQ-binding-like beta-propeller repeat protein [Candidatus Bathyarchaeota archaeon]
MAKPAQVAFLVSLLCLSFLSFSPAVSNAAQNDSSTTIMGTQALQLWRYPTAAPIVSDLTVHNGLVYGTSSWTSAPTDNIFCLDAKTGEQVWELNGYNPVITQETVFASSRGSNVLDPSIFHALNASTGEQLWNITYSGWSSYCVLDGGVIYVGSTANRQVDVYRDENSVIARTASAGIIQALNASTGTQIWEYTEIDAKINGIIKSGETIYALSNLYNSTDNSRRCSVYAVNASGGEKLWNYTVAGVFEWQVMAKNCLCLGHQSQNAAGDEDAKEIIALEAKSGAKLWDKLSIYGLGRPVYANDVLYVTAENGEAYAFDALNGNTLWSYKAQPEVGELDVFGGASEPLLVNDRVYFADYSGVHCLSALDGAQIWKFTNPTRDYSYAPGAEDGSVATALTYSNGSIFVGSGGPLTFNKWLEHNVYALDAVSGNKIWNYTIENVVNNPVVVVDDVVYIAADEVTHYSSTYLKSGAVYAFKLQTVEVPAPTPTPRPANPPTGAIVVPDDYYTIQEAIDNASDGDTIFVRRDTYYAQGHSGIVIDKQISLIGEDPQTTIIKKSWYRYPQSVIQITADNVTVLGFTILGDPSNVGILIEDSSNHVPSRCNIIGNNIVGNLEGILARGNNKDIAEMAKPSFNVFCNNNISDNKGFGIYVSSSNTTITNNTIAGNGAGAIIADSCANITIAGNFISGRSITDPTNTHENGGIFLRWWGPFYVYGNNITQNGKAAITFGENCSNASIHDNSITDNNIGIQLNNVTADNVGKGNVVFSNNFVDNQQQVVVMAGTTDEVLWDNGEVGNYWSDYAARYPEASEIAGSGIADTPYGIDENNADYYPRLEALVVPEFALWSVLPLILAATVLAGALLKRKTKPASYIATKNGA